MGPRGCLPSHPGPSPGRPFQPAHLTRVKETATSTYGGLKTTFTTDPAFRELPAAGS